MQKSLAQSVAYLDPLVAAQVEVKLERVRDAGVHRRAGWNVLGFAGSVPGVLTEQSRVVALLHHQERDERAVVFLQAHARLLDRAHLV